MITVDNIHFSYRNNCILRNVSFSIKAGECIGIVGANGCGKSTLLSILSGSRRCHNASMIYDNTDLLKDSRKRSSLIGYVPQENPLMADLNVFDNLLLWFHGSKGDLEQALLQPSISMLGIQSFLKKPAKELSGGMKKRVSFALALINQPRLLILDEPSAALDLPCKSDIHNYLQTFLKEGRTILLTTHEEDELSLCTTLYILMDGMLHPVPKDLRGQGLIAQL